MANPKKDKHVLQPSGENVSFWKTLPGALTALTGLITAVGGLMVALHQFGGDIKKPGGDEKANLSPVTNPPSVSSGNSEPVSCKVSGYVYNQDGSQHDGLAGVRVAYVLSSQSNTAAIPIATTGRDGHFSFVSSLIRPDEFPVRLQMTYSLLGGKQVVQWDDQIYPPGNSDMQVYLSTSQITNSYRLQTKIMYVSPVTRLNIDRRLTIPH